MIVDLHNHTKRCNHAEGEVAEFVEVAINNGTKYFGFSDHAPMGFDEKHRMKREEMPLYEADVLKVKEVYKKDIEILLGYEVDYLDGYILDEVMRREVDYFIGSVHFIGKWGFDNPEFIREYEGKDLDSVWQDYFDAIESMAKTGLFDIVGHLDLIKIFKFFPKKDVRLIAKNALKAIKSSGMSVEINLAGYRKPVTQQYPSRELLEEIYALDIPITFGSDGHRVSEIGLNRDLGVALAKEIGFCKCALYKNRERQLINF